MISNKARVELTGRGRHVMGEISSGGSGVLAALYFSAWMVNIWVFLFYYYALNCIYTFYVVFWIKKKVAGSLFVLESQVASKINLVNYKKSRFWESRFACTAETTHTHTLTWFASHTIWDTNSRPRAHAPSFQLRFSATRSGWADRTRSVSAESRLPSPAAHRCVDAGQRGWLWTVGKPRLRSSLGKHTFPFWKSYQTFPLPLSKECPTSQLWEPEQDRFCFWFFF